MATKGMNVEAIGSYFDSLLDLRPSIAAPRTGSIGSDSSWCFPTASPRLIMALKPDAFQECFQEWITHAIGPDESQPDRLSAIDGKTNPRSHHHAAEFGPLHFVTARASKEGIALGLVATEAKSKEVTAIPLLLVQIELTDALVTIDEMGCQKEIARAIGAGVATS